MPLWKSTGLSLALAVGLAAGAAAAPLAPAPPEAGAFGLPMQITGTPEDDDACEAVIEAQDWEQVIALCEPLLAIHDENHRLFQFIGENVEYAHTTVNYANQQRCLQAAQGGDWDTTLDACPATIEAFPDFLVGHLFVGLAHNAKGATAEANASLERFVTVAGENPELAEQLKAQLALAQRTVALNNLEAGDAAAALPMLRAAAEGDPTDAEIHFRLGYALLQEDDPEGAQAAFNVVIELNPDIPQLGQVLFLAGQLAYNAQNYEEASSRLSAYLEREPEGDQVTEAHWLLGSMAARADQTNTAVTHFAAFLDGESSGERAALANYSLGTIYYNRNQCDRALTYYNRFIRLSPNAPQAADVRETILDIEDGLCEPF